MIPLLNKKTFLLKEYLYRDIVREILGREPVLEDARRMTIVSMSGDVKHESILWDGEKIGDIECEFPELQVIFTFYPVTEYLIGTQRISTQL